MSQEIFVEQEQVSKTFKDKLKLTMSGLSGAYMLPIATLVSVAIFLSLGGFMESLVSEGAVKRIASFIKSLAYPLLQTIPLLFCVAFSISFCKGDATCIWNSVIAYLVFLSVHGVFIKSTTVPTNGYVILFEGAGRDPTLMQNLIDKNLGFTSMNTSIFGSFVIGGVVMPYIHRHFFNVQLKGPFAFFSGKRFVPFLAIVFSATASMFFLLFWPWVGYGFAKFGHYLSQTPYGIDSFIFGLLEKSLIPTGLHHMFYAPLWFTSLGGDAVSRINEIVKSCESESIKLSTQTTTQICEAAKTAFSVATLDRPLTSTETIAGLFKSAKVPNSMWQGDSFLGLSIISAPTNTVTVDSTQLSVFDFFKSKLGINVGRYTQGKFPIMQFCLPAAVWGLSLATDSPWQSFKSLLPGVLSCSLLGITEPVEFLFLFSAPVLFYGFHAVMCGISFMLMNIFGAHIPSILSGGFVELVIMGILPVAKGTAFYWYFLVGALLAPIYLGTFYVAAKRKIVNAFEKSSESQKEAVSDSKVPEATRKLAMALGGWENISKMSNCASRLRYDIVDKSKVNEESLKSAGVIAIKWVGDNHLQAIVGPKAEIINQEMVKWNGEKL